MKSPGPCKEVRCNICPVQIYAPTGAPPEDEQLPLFAHDDDYPMNVHESDGGSTDYYKFMPDETDLSDVIERLNMPFSRANIFKACMRLGQKKGTSIEYDLNKMLFFIQRMINAHKKGYKV